MLPHQKLIYPCPFCDEETIEVLWWPSHKSAKISRSAVAKRTTWRRESEGLVLLSKECPKCGKSAREIERRWKGLD
jgi:endogenous inhibitor of DNA gyrase (YacG/DUF329 family)